ncbi:hypothetical protein BC832DRAFT_351852 [Gaertneriomyces semiglobifer]|nr:hypothetical protein BC832DRAFT_351852 [Gaertneriomyces semiglobifer]
MAATMNPAEELKFATHFLHSISSLPIKYQPDYVPPLSQWFPTLPTASRPFALRDKSNPTTEPSITITLKPLKSPITLTQSKYTLPPLTPIHSLKSQIAASTKRASSSLRLVYKGKVLVDTKTLQDYDMKDGATVHLMLAAGAKQEEQVQEQQTVPAVQETVSNRPADDDESIYKAKGCDAQLWTDLRGVVNKHFDDKHAEKVLGEFVKSYHQLCGPLSVGDRDALRKAEKGSA